MIEFQNTDIECLADLKHRYHGQTTAPLDGMWLCGFVPQAKHMGIYHKSKQIGYVCCNEEGYLLQFYVDPTAPISKTAVFETLLDQNTSSFDTIKGAFVSTAEPVFLSLCLDHFDTFDVNALMYQYSSTHSHSVESKQEPFLATVGKDQLRQAVEFAQTAIGAPEEWLQGYYVNLIERGELFGYWQNHTLIGLGESRGYDDFQKDYADLGVIVAPDFRKKGVATKILKELISITRSKGLTPLCSTEKDNIAAIKAIEAAGFVANNRLVQFFRS